MGLSNTLACLTSYVCLLSSPECQYCLLSIAAASMSFLVPLGTGKSIEGVRGWNHSTTNLLHLEKGVKVRTPPPPFPLACLAPDFMEP